MSGLDYLVRIVKEAKIFKRNKVPLQDKVLSALMHYSGSSLRSIANGEASHMKLLDNGIMP